MTVTKTKAKDKASTGLLVLPTGTAQSDAVTVRPLPLPSSSSSSSSKNKESSNNNNNSLSHLHLHAVYSHNCTDGTDNDNPKGNGKANAKAKAKAKGYINDDDTLRLQAIVEFHKYAPAYGSFLIVPSTPSTSSTTDGDDDDVNAVSNGGLTFMTRVDPLFVVLALPCAQRQDVFQPLHDYVVYTAATSPSGGVDGDECGRKSVDIDMTALVTPEQLALLCETKDALGETYYRIAEDKVMAWLSTKLCKLNEKETSGTTTVADTVQPVAVRDRRHAVDLIAHYLSDEWAAKFKQGAGLNGTTTTTTTTSANGLQQQQEEGNDDDDDDSDTPAMQTQGAAADLAMSVMLADAQTNNGGFDATQYQQPQQSTPSTTATTVRKQPTRKPIVSSNVSANAKKFWAAQGAKKDKDGNKAKSKTTPTSSKAKAKTSGSGGGWSASAKRKRSGSSK